MHACRYTAARSAPVYPELRAASSLRSTSEASGACLVWYFSISVRSCAAPHAEWLSMAGRNDATDPDCALESQYAWF